MKFKLPTACKVAFQCTKEEISKNVTLPYFNPNTCTILQTDASKKGLGDVLLQNSKPVMFVSMALTGSERNYQNLERECLATIWGMDKSHYFLYGKEFTLEMDQKPLVSIYKKDMVEISPNDPEVSSEKLPISTFQCLVQKRSEIPLAATVSHVTSLPMEEDGIQLPIIAVNLVTKNIPYSSNKLDNIHEETRKDSILNILMHYINIGWPCERRMLPQELHP